VVEGEGEAPERVREEENGGQEEQDQVQELDELKRTKECTEGAVIYVCCY
jgi:hypothetical protein